MTLGFDDKNINFANDESCHLALLLFIKDAQAFLLSKSLLIGSTNKDELQ